MKLACSHGRPRLGVSTRSCSQSAFSCSWSPLYPSSRLPSAYRQSKVTFVPDTRAVRDCIGAKTKEFGCELPRRANLRPASAAPGFLGQGVVLYAHQMARTQDAPPIGQLSCPRYHTDNLMPVQPWPFTLNPSSPPPAECANKVMSRSPILHSVFPGSRHLVLMWKVSISLPTSFLAQFVQFPIFPKGTTFASDTPFLTLSPAWTHLLVPKTHVR